MNIFKKIIKVLSRNKKKQEIKQNNECINTTKDVWPQEQKIYKEPPCVKYDKNKEMAKRLLYIIKNI